MVTASGAAQVSGDEPEWPAAADGRRVIFLLDASSRLERRLLETWIARHRPPAPAVDAALDAHLAAGDDPLLAPLRDPGALRQAPPPGPLPHRRRRAGARVRAARALAARGRLRRRADGRPRRLRRAPGGARARAG